MCAPRKSLMVELKGCHLHKGPLCKVRTISPYCYYGHPSSFEVVTKRLGTLSFSQTFLSQYKSKQKNPIPHEYEVYVKLHMSKTIQVRIVRYIH